MSIGRRVHIPNVGGKAGEPPFSPELEEARRAADNITLILGIEPGQWPMYPDIGTPIASSLLEEAADTTQEKYTKAIVRAQIQRYEPHVSIEDVRVEVFTGDRGQIRARIVVRVFLLRVQRLLTLAINQGFSA